MGGVGGGGWGSAATKDSSPHTSLTCTSESNACLKLGFQ